MSRTYKFYSGWKMTWSQHQKYFRLLDDVYRANGITTAAEKEQVRRAIHVRAFGHPVSAKQIDHLKMFDSFKAECLAMSRPANLEAQLLQTEMPIIRLRHACRQIADEAYIAALVRSPLFKKKSLDDDDWTEQDLTNLRNTLTARSVSHRRKYYARKTSIHNDL
ncbi:MAG: hypothetical protein KGL39_56185 [Patescibacteria group bacterium]|nr:hypothetical protein [Patescibacteria group bacterium]